MADFARWSTACETAIWPTGTFWTAYSSNRDEAVADVIEADPVANAVRALMATRTKWTGTASQLLDVLTGLVEEVQRKSKSWPDAPRILSGRLRRAATFLRKAGIEVVFDRETSSRRNRTISITTQSESERDFASASSASSSPRSIPLQNNDLRENRQRTIGDAVDEGTVTKPFNGADGADDTDANFPHYPGGSPTVIDL
jgi:hypothetical protein